MHLHHITRLGRLICERRNASGWVWSHTVGGLAGQLAEGFNKPTSPDHPVPTQLDNHLLTAFESRLRLINPLVFDNWAPGVPDARIDELLGPLGIDLPDEARVWWGRHDGAAAGAPRPATRIVPGRSMLSLERAAAECSKFGDLGDELYGMPEIAKHLRFVGGEPMIYVDCNGPRCAPAPIYWQNDFTEPPRPVLPSIGELILIWIELVDDGAFEADPDGGWRRPTEGSISPALQWLGYG